MARPLHRRRWPRRIAWLFAIAGISYAAFLCLPVVGFDAPRSFALIDRRGELIGASTAADEQWRFSSGWGPGRPVPERFVRALLRFEDRRFYSHWGVDPYAVLRAMWQNARVGCVVSGASTLSMQVIRLARKERRRTLGEKLVETVLALRMEHALSKDEILGRYATHAPFGGNVVGLEAAAWRYFGREPERLSWAEAACLAVLPNAPSLIHPGRNRGQLRSKRDRLLDSLREDGALDAETCRLAKLEPLPPAPLPMPDLAPRLVQRLKRESSPRTRSSLDAGLQRRAREIVERHHVRLASAGVHNAAALILDTETGEVLAYAGNAGQTADSRDGVWVDMVRAERSTGSILKPLLYAAMLDAGELLPGQLVADVPTRFGGFVPENYRREFAGAVPASRALARSLNVPAVRMLRDFGADRFHALLGRLGMTSLHRPAADYGLSLIVGGAEGSLWEITGIYAALGRRVLRAGLGDEADAFFPPTLEPGGAAGQGRSPLGPGACYLTLKAMLEVERPGDERAWRAFGSARRVAWKTGTSHGFRDAWAVGVTPAYTVGVWAGNADGEGRAGLVGYTAAAPLLFDLFDSLPPEAGWFAMPRDDLQRVQVCAKSGMRAGPLCAHTHEAWIPRAGLRSGPCAFCRQVHLDETGAYRVHADCESISRMQSREIFVLPPEMEHYYRRRHADYRPLPPWRAGCEQQASGPAELSCIQPGEGAEIYVPVELDGLRGRAVFEAAHRRAGARVFWHLDDRYCGQTRDIHQLALAPEPGEHLLTLVDDEGETVERRFVAK
ncbi:MAG: penicillin-binding protein 1C [Deltaproteobacteria bacterium]|nr:penicillin-binding protein 1C [Deltaproteobacteria bacterium]